MKGLPRDCQRGKIKIGDGKTSPDDPRGARRALPAAVLRLIPHNKALGIRILAVARGAASMQLDWREELVGNPETGVLAGGAADGDARRLLRAWRWPRCSPSPGPSLPSTCASTTRKPAVPGKPVIAEAECYRITRSVAFTRAFAHQGDPKDPVAAAAGTFMLGTKGEATRPVMARGDAEMSGKLMKRLAEGAQAGQRRAARRGDPLCALDADRAGERHGRAADAHALSRQADRQHLPAGDPWRHLWAPCSRWRRSSI